MAQTPFGQISLGHTLLQTEPETQSPVDLYMPGLHTELPFIILIGTYSFRYSIYINIYIYLYIYKEILLFKISFDNHVGNKAHFTYIYQGLLIL